MKKIMAFLISFLVTVIILLFIYNLWLSELKANNGIGDIVSIGLGIYLPHVLNLFQDCFDIVPWQSDLRKLKRGKIITRNDFIRISFAYLFRIKVENKYLLVLNKRGTQKYQPVGGAYKYNEVEMLFIRNKFSVVDDSKIKLDTSSQNDYRLFVPAKNLKKFIKRFDKTHNREMIDDLSREFREELVNTGIVDFSNIKYRLCGRHFTKIEYSRYFNCHELLMADIVELIPTKVQNDKLKTLTLQNSEDYIFASEEQIKSCGVFAGTDDMLENIGDHANKILQCEEINLLKVKGVKKTFEAKILKNSLS